MSYRPGPDDIRCANCREWYHKALKACPMCDAPNVPHSGQPRTAPQQQAPPVQQPRPVQEVTQPPTAPAPRADAHEDMSDRKGKTMTVVGMIAMSLFCFATIANDNSQAQSTAWFYTSWIALCALVGKAAHTKGYSYYWGMGLSALFSPIVGAIAVGVRPKNQEELDRRKIWAGTARKCPYCAEVIKIEATVCRHCGRDL